ncbi:MAG: nucleoside-triphosphatase [Thermoanaerobaculia bacterium]|nr:nucleoside-triphosphatase [Thermoanaerobaculia bacterium]
MSSVLLLTGRPGVGKTTVLRRVAESLGDRRLAGFYTEEIRDERGHRRGFRGIPFAGGEERTIASTEISGGPRVSKYGVDVEAVDRLVEETLIDVDDAHLVLLDEIGKMECHSEEFVEAVKVLLEGDLPLVATVAGRGGGFMARVREHSDAELVEVTKENRDELPERVMGWIEEVGRE